MPTFKKIFHDKEYELTLAREPRTIVDLGANIGLASIYFAMRYPDAKIIALEPEASNFALLVKNVRPFHNVTPVCAAIWNENGAVNLLDPGMGPWGFRTSATKENDASTLGRVTAITIEHLLHTHQIDHLDLLKVDIEGSEKELFQGQPGWIDRIGVVMIEVHDTMRRGAAAAVANAMRNFGCEQHKGENVFYVRPEYLPTQ